MRRNTMTSAGVRVGALALSIALLSATPVAANPDADLLDSWSANEASSSTTAPNTSATPSSSTSGLTPVARRSATPSEVDVDVDSDTEEFREELSEKQRQLDEFENQLMALDRELEVATEEYNAAVEQLAKIKEDVDTAKAELDEAQGAFDMQSELLGDRATSIYRTGEFNAVEVLLNSSSMADLISRVKFLNTMGIRDADIASSLRAQKDLLDQRVDDLRDVEAEAQSLEFELKARRIEVMLRFQERQQVLTEARQELIELLDDEAVRRQADQSQLLAEILSGASSKGIVAKPGTPVETALAYHGIPYLWGGESPSGFDCSGLVLYVFDQHGVTLPHYSGSQFQLGQKVAIADLVPGDVVFFGSPIHHVGIYMGGGYYIHAPRTGDFIKISRLADRRDYAGARRYPWTYRTSAPKGAVKSTTDALAGYNANR